MGDELERCREIANAIKRDGMMRVGDGGITRIQEARAEARQEVLDSWAAKDVENARLRERYREAPEGTMVRDAARQRYALTGPDAQALEGALQQADRECARLRAELEAVPHRDINIAGVTVGHVTALVKAVRVLKTKCESWGIDTEDIGDELEAVFQGLKPFEGE